MTIDSLVSPVDNVIFLQASHVKHDIWHILPSSHCSFVFTCFDALKSKLCNHLKMVSMVFANHYLALYNFMVLESDGLDD